MSVAPALSFLGLCYIGRVLTKMWRFDATFAFLTHFWAKKNAISDFLAFFEIFCVP